MTSLVRRIFTPTIATLAIAACSSEQAEPSPRLEPLATQASAITTACSEDTFGLPCDPDAAGALTECEGVCWMTFTQAAPFTPVGVCLPVTDVAQKNDGKLCGNGAGNLCSGPGVGKCLGASCIPLSSPYDSDGHGCRPGPGAGGNVCHGICKAGDCADIDPAVCPIGREVVVVSAQPLPACRYRACDVRKPLPPEGCDYFDLLSSTTCSDGTLCTLGENVPKQNQFSELCDSQGKCLAGAPKSCNDSNVCTTDSCIGPAGACTNVPNTNACDDKNACTTNDTCSAGSCVGGPAPSCNDGNPCTADSCNAAVGCVNTPTPGVACNDANACTTGDFCNGSGVCAGTAIVCNDDNSCTSNGCNTATGACVFTPTPGVPCTDGTACTADDKCSSAGACVGTAVSCDDNHPCTTDSCNPATGCVHTPNPAAACSDGNPCTTSDTCTASGTCVGSAKNCADENPCTIDGCSPTSGECVHTNSTASCSDNNACTEGDLCSAGACQPGATKSCDDGNPCTIDSCNTGTGCVHTAVVGCPPDAGSDAATGGTGGSAGADSGSTGGTGGATDAATDTTTGGVAGSTSDGATDAAGGSAGAGGSATDGSATDGSATGGSATGGSATGGSTTGGTGGADAGAGTGGAPLDVEEDDGGCGCRVPERTSSGGELVLLGALGWLVRRRRRSHGER